MTRRSWPALVLVALLLLAGTLAGCGEPSPEERRETYCDLVDEKSEELTRATDEGGPGAFVDVLPTLEELGDAAPSDLKDEWQVFLNALHGLRDVLEDTGVDPDQVTGELPETLTRDERRRIRGAAALLVSDEVRAAVQGIEQQALDVCKTQLL